MTVTNPFVQQSEKSPFSPPEIVSTQIGEWSQGAAARLGGMLGDNDPLLGAVKYAHWHTDKIENQLKADAFEAYHRKVEEFLPALTEEGADIVEVASDAPQSLEEVVETDPWVKRLHAYDYYTHAIAKEMDDADWWDHTKAIILPDLSIDAAQMTGGEDGKLGAFFSGTGDLTKWHNAFLQSSDPVAFVKGLHEHATAVSDNNPRRVAELMQAVVEGPSAWGFALDKAALVTAPLDIMGVTSLGKAAFRSVARRSSAVSTAATHQQRAGAMSAAVNSPESAAAVGVRSDSAQLGVLDQEGLIDTGMPARNIAELEQYERALEDFNADLVNRLDEVALPDPELEASRLRPEAVGMRASRLLGPDAAFGVENDILLVQPRYVAEQAAAYLRQERIKPLALSIEKDVKASGNPTSWYNLMEDLDDKGEWWSAGQFQQYFESQGMTVKQAEMATRGARKMRLLADNEYRLLNKFEVDKMKEAGYTKQAHIQGKNIAFRPFDDLESAKMSMRHKKVDVAYNTITGKKVTWAGIDKAVGDANMLVKSYRKSDLADLSMGDNGVAGAWDYMIIPKTSAENLTMAIKPRVGYFPRFNDKVRYLAKVPVAGKINGADVPEAYWKVDRAFSTSQKAAVYEKNNPGVKITESREWTPADSTNVHDMHGGGMYTGGRASSKLKVDGKQAVRIKSPEEAMSRAYNYLVNRGLLMKTTENAEQLWMKTAAPYMNEIGKAAPFNDARMEALYNYIQRMKNGNGGKVNGTNGIMFRLAKAYRHDNTIAKALWGAADMDVIQKLKGVAYTSFMGFGSPVQMIIQSSAMVPVFAKSPGAFTKAMPLIAAARETDLLPSSYKLLKGEYKEAYDLWKTSGLSQSVNNVPDFVRIGTSPAAEKAERLSNFFVEEGERNARAAAFFTAYMKLPKAERTRRNVLLEARRLGMDLTSANKSAWQDGVTGLLFQFQQILAKGYAEYAPVVAGGKAAVTARERAQLWAMTAVGLGLSGLPFGDIIDTYVPQMLPKDTDPTYLEVLKRGMTGVLMKTAGLDNEISTRIALAPSLPMVVQHIIEGNASFFDVFGPSGTLIDRSVQAMKTAKEALIKHQAPENLITALMGLPSSTRHLAAAYLYDRTGMLYGRMNQARPIVHLNMGEKILLGIGLQPTEIQDYYSQEQIERSREEYKREVINIMHRDLVTGFRSSDELHGALVSFAVTDPDFYEEVMQGVVRKIKENPDIRSKMIDRWMEGKWFGTPTEAYLRQEIMNGE